MYLAWVLSGYQSRKWKKVLNAKLLKRLRKITPLYIPKRQSSWQITNRKSMWRVMSLYIWQRHGIIKKKLVLEGGDRNIVLFIDIPWWFYVEKYGVFIVSKVVAVVEIFWWLLAPLLPRHQLLLLFWNKLVIELSQQFIFPYSYLSISISPIAHFLPWLFNLFLFFSFF